MQPQRARVYPRTRGLPIAGDGGLNLARGRWCANRCGQMYDPTGRLRGLEHHLFSRAYTRCLLPTTGSPPARMQRGGTKVGPPLTPYYASTRSCRQPTPRAGSRGHGSAMKARRGRGGAQALRGRGRTSTSAAGLRGGGPGPNAAGRPVEGLPAADRRPGRRAAVRDDLRPDRHRPGSVLNYVAFGTRHQPKGSHAPTVYAMAHRRLHGRWPSQVPAEAGTVGHADRVASHRGQVHPGWSPLPLTKRPRGGATPGGLHGREAFHAVQP